MANGILFDIRRFSLHDGPGIRTTVFFKGCPLKCRWCHNPESQSPRRELVFRRERCIHCLACLEACPHGASVLVDGDVATLSEACQSCGACVEACYADARQIAGWESSAAEAFAAAGRDAAFYEKSGGGVTFSGGEPLMQPDFLLELLQICKGRGFHTALDTCGFARWEIIERVRPFVDLFLYDIKVVDPERHRRFTGVSNRLILENLSKLCAHGHDIILRAPLIPGVNDGQANIEALGALAARLSLRRVDVLPYHNTAGNKYEGLNRPYSLSGLQPQSKDEINEIARQLGAFGLHIRVGG